MTGLEHHWMIGGLAACHLATHTVFRYWQQRTGTTPARWHGARWHGARWHGAWGRGVVMALFYGPTIVYQWSAGALAFAHVPLGEGWRLAASALGWIAMGLLVWALASQQHHAMRDRLHGRSTMLRCGPYRWLRYADSTADVGVFTAVAVLSANLVVAGGVLLGAWILRYVVLVRLERARLEQWGARYRAHGRRTGWLLVRWRVPPPPYVVPRRFGLSAVMALLTTFSLIFGGLNYAQAPPGVYLFAAFEIVAICIAQIVFGRAPRSASAVSGAVLLPLCVLMQVSRPRWMTIEMLVYCVTFLVLFGAFLGYCLGTLAAGFFLVMDKIDPYLPGGSRSLRDVRVSRVETAPPAETPRHKTT